VPYQFIPINSFFEISFRAGNTPYWFVVRENANWKKSSGCKQTVMGLPSLVVIHEATTRLSAKNVLQFTSMSSESPAFAWMRYTRPFVVQGTQVDQKGL
jgi:hypothetical protein